jgi:hypothetical protein
LSRWCAASPSDADGGARNPDRTRSGQAAGTEADDEKPQQIFADGNMRIVDADDVDQKRHRQDRSATADQPE